MNKLGRNERSQILTLLCEGQSIRATSRLTGASKNTITKLLVDAGMESMVLSYEFEAALPPPVPASLAGTARAAENAEPAPSLQNTAASVAARFNHLRDVEAGGPDAIQIELAICARDVFYWFRWYAWTYDPRNSLENPPLPTWMPFDLFPRQVELVKWFEYLREIKQDGCLKKSRDVGFTWLAGALAWHKWRFAPGFKTTFGSRKVEYVDRLGDPDSFFERIRLLYRGLPKWMLPVGFNPHLHDNHMLMVNPDNGNTIRGEGGDEMGRGGRSTWYLIDEAAQLEHADRVDAATSANAEVRIWGSSINPRNENNLFQRKYMSFPPERVFRFHYSDDPRKTPEWAARKQESVSEEVWAAEYEIDDTFTVEDICIPAAWVASAKRVKKVLEAKCSSILGSFRDAAGTLPSPLPAACLEQVKKYTLEPAINGTAGGDVGGGKASSAVVVKLGAVILPPIAWRDPDTIDTAFKMLDACQAVSVRRADGHDAKVRALRFDSIGVGFGVSAAMKRNPRPGLIVVGVNVGEPPSDMRWPDGEESTAKFANLKAEGWWAAREAFKRTHELVLWLEEKLDGVGNRVGRDHPITEIISLPDDSAGALSQRLCAELSQVKWSRNERGKIVIESKLSLSKRGLPSPDIADAFILNFTGFSKAEKWAQMAKVRELL